MLCFWNKIVKHLLPGPEHVFFTISSEVLQEEFFFQTVGREKICTTAMREGFPKQMLLEAIFTRLKFWTEKKMFLPKLVH